ncbi:hypothetical protein CR513_30509, partial [Mucuna pruriens]
MGFMLTERGIKANPEKYQEPMKCQRGATTGRENHYLAQIPVSVSRNGLAHLSYYEEGRKFPMDRGDRRNFLENEGDAGGPLSLLG